MDDLKPYLEYKDSGVEGLGQVPKHWDMRKLWTISKIRNEKNPGNLRLLSVFLDHGVIPHKTGAGQTHAPSLDLSNYQVVHIGDFVLNNQQAWRGSVGVSKLYGIISPAYVVLELTSELDTTFVNYLFRSTPIIDQFVIASRGVGSIQRDLHMPSLRLVRVPIPSSEEQSNIVRFLEYTNRQINNYINSKRRLIDLLNERKQAIISHAVTQGIDPNVRLKPSGIEWLGDVPEHWDVIKGRACYQEKNEPNVGLKEKTVLSLSYGKIVVKPEEKLHGLVPSSFESYQIVDPGDIICRPTDLQNDWNSLRFGLSNYRGIITSAYICFHTTDLLDRRYGHLLLHTYDLNKVFYGLGSGLRQNLGWKDFKDLSCLVPPIPEQSSIVKFVEEATTDLDDVIVATKAEIDLLKGYRTRIISDVVTGKVDVRGVVITNEAPINEDIIGEMNEFDDNREDDEE